MNCPYCEQELVFCKKTDEDEEGYKLTYSCNYNICRVEFVCLHMLNEQKEKE